MRISVSEIGFWSSRAVLAAAIAWLGFHRGTLAGLGANDIRSAAGIVAQIGATMLGLVLAALAVLASIANSRLVRNMAKTGHYHVLLRRMLVALLAFGLSTCTGIAGIFLPIVQNWQAYILFGTVFFAALLFLDIASKFWMVLHHLSPE